jgi:hypothetical protein
MLLVYDPAPGPLFVKKSERSGLICVDQHIPLSEIVPPPVEVIVPPDVAEFIVIDVTLAVVTVGGEEACVLKLI